ncbi:hypothetical protein AB0L53_57025 [Nonomuraea sp. NPDC052129]|uniref:hypothetical protein n=1 Tax=Nonomuraea sp. NPDC052129 TaxID=3154651 RepID=UPI00343FBF70
MRAQVRPEHRRDRYGRDQAAIGEHTQRHERIAATGFDHRERHEQRGGLDPLARRPGRSDRHSLRPDDDMVIEPSYY